MRCILHIGIDEAGGESLAAWLYANETVLAARGIALSRALAPGSAHDLARCCKAGRNELVREGEELRASGPDAQAIDALAAALSEDVAGREAETFVVTQPTLAASLRTEADIAQLKTLLAAPFEAVRVVVYLREQSEVLAQRYADAVLAGREARLRKLQGDIDPDAHGVNYETMLGPWAAVFGEDAVTPVIYDAAGPVGQASGLDFVQRVAPQGERTVFGERQVPAATSRLRATLANALNRGLAGYGANATGVVEDAHRDMLAFIAGDADLEGPPVHHPDAERIHRAFTPSNRAMAKRFLGREDNPFAQPGRRPDQKQRATEVERRVGQFFEAFGKRFLARRVMSESDCEVLRDIALKYPRGESMSRDDALALLQMAQRVRPGGKVIAAAITDIASMPDRPAPAPAAASRAEPEPPAEPDPPAAASASEPAPAGPRLVHSTSAASLGEGLAAALEEPRRDEGAEPASEPAAAPGDGVARPAAADEAAQPLIAPEGTEGTLEGTEHGEDGARREAPIAPRTDSDALSAVAAALAGTSPQEDGPPPPPAPRAPTIEEILATVAVDAEARESQRPAAEPATRRFVIYFTPRSGSSWLHAAMRNTNELGDPNEFFNPGFVENIARRNFADTLDDYCDAILRRHKTPNDVFSVQITAFQFNRIGDKDTFFHWFPSDAPAVFLIRENIVRQAISLYKAVETSVFHTVSADAQSVARSRAFDAYDGEKILKWVRHIRRQEVLHETMFETRGIEPLRLSYETMFADPEAVVPLIARHFAVTLSDGALRGTPQNPHKPLASDTNAALEERFRHEQADYLRLLDARRRDTIAELRLRERPLQRLISRLAH